MPKVSIITAAYNHRRFVRQSVESALNQTYRDFEHIVVDDGSTDGTAEVLKSFGNRIKYIRQDNRGAHAAINAGIRESSGEYIAILDSDDVWLPHKLERQIPAFTQNPDAAVVYSQARMIDGDGEIFLPDRMLGAPVNQECPLEDLLANNRIPVLTAVIRRRCFDDVGGFAEKLKAVADWELWLRVAARWPLVFLPEPLALYRVHGCNTYDRMVSSGQVIRERLMVLKNMDASLLGDKRRGRLDVIYAFTALQQAYALSYQGHNSKAMTCLLFALRLRPSLLKDLVAALRFDPTLFKNGKPRRLIANIVFGPRRSKQSNLIEVVDSERLSLIPQSGDSHG